MGREERLKVDDGDVANAAHHPGFVHIPDAGTEGVRTYHEPAEPRPLQITFLSKEGEAAWTDHIRRLLGAGRFDEAAEILENDLAGFDGRIAKRAKAMPLDAIMIEGWDDLDEILAEYEGPAITAVTAGLANEPDLVFDTSQEHEPTLMFNLYSDDVFDFSSRADHELIEECHAEMPGWSGHDEDVEFYVSIEGFAPLNSALIQCKHIHFLRDGRDGVEGRAPGGYCEYVLGCWLRTTRFLQAMQREMDAHGLPGGARLITGTVGMNADVATVIGAKAEAPAPSAAATSLLAAKRGATGAPLPEDPAPAATLTMKKWEPKHDPLADMESGSSLRQRLSGDAPAQPATPAPPLVEPMAPAPEAIEPEPAPVEPAPEVAIPDFLAPQDPPPPPSRGGFFKRLFGKR
ncbi:hypothetical protein [Sphingomicrobium sediminis]|uniref:Uncharacterized protein n=1 Tax=Sphingomicrobium sediminis TaxID=2950949 RepID=A0A9X2EH90_9SPHN|nr:hypothetical protein [Sphingomicrobium sediminis]MCM8557998.1 hypothetical protein [Sphingomicrobium sediminis]